MQTDTAGTEEIGAYVDAMTPSARSRAPVASAAASGITARGVIPGLAEAQARQQR